MISNERTCRVLIADDSPEISSRLIDSLSALSDVETIGPANDSDEALELFQSRNPDVAILDVNMPGTCVIDVVKSMRRHSPAALLIAVSISESIEFRQRFKSVGADHFLSKRSELERVAEIIQLYRAGSRLP